MPNKKTQTKNKRTKKDSQDTKQFIRWVIGLSIAITGIIVSVIIFFYTPPIFYLEQSILRSGNKIFIYAGNWSADNEEHLHVKFDGIVFKKAGVPTKNTDNGRQKWVFSPKKHAIPDMLEKGIHSICFAFDGEDFSTPQNITFTSERIKKPARKEDKGIPIFLILLVIIIIGGMAVLGKILYDRNIRCAAPTDAGENDQGNKGLWPDK